MIYKGSKDAYTLTDRIAQGGEGAIYKIKGNSDILAKIYLKDTAEQRVKLAVLEQKLRYMANNPPDASVLDSISWPLDLLYDASGAFCGFTMPKMKTDAALKSVYPYNPGTPSLLTYHDRVVVALNLCVVISAVHAAGYIFGDFNPLNIGVDLQSGHVGFFDTDSYHFVDQHTGKVYRCTVCLPGYVAPEVIARCRNSDYANAPLPTFTARSDDFALAVHIFALLFNGFTPFNGIGGFENPESASLPMGNKAIEQGCYAFKKGKKPLSAGTPDINAFPPKIKRMFERAFVDGEKDPSARPDANEWRKALEDYMKRLTVCSVDPSHYYDSGASSCPYCAADRRHAAQTAQPFKQYTFQPGRSQPQAAPAQPAPKTPLWRRAVSSIRGAFHRISLKKALLIVLAVIGLVAGILLTVRACSSVKHYDDDKLLFSVEKKEGAYLYINGLNKNEAVGKIYGTLRLTDLAGGTLFKQEIWLGGVTDKDGRNSWDFHLEVNDDYLQKVIDGASLDRLLVYFRVTKAEFLDGTVGQYTENTERLIGGTPAKPGDMKKYDESLYSVALAAKNDDTLTLITKNDSTAAIKYVIGEMIIYDKNGDRIKKYTVLLKSVAGSLSEPTELALPNAPERLRKASSDELSFTFRVTSMLFEDGTARVFVDSPARTVQAEKE